MSCATAPVVLQSYYTCAGTHAYAARRGGNMEDIRDGMTPGGEETGASAAAGGDIPVELPAETPGFGACKDEETAAAVTPYPETGRGELATEDAEAPEKPLPPPKKRTRWCVF